MARLRRARGWLLRAVLKRTTAIVFGTFLSVPALWLWWGDYFWERWYTDGLALVLGATGIALILAGIGGRRPDWLEPDR